MNRHPYVQLLSESARKNKSVLCFGMDPVAERMKIDDSLNIGDEIVRYFAAILDAIAGRIAAVKPNAAYYLQYGDSGLRALSRLIQNAHGMGLPVILDIKAGDIGRTSAAYARFVFEELCADAVTLNPYMGFDAVEPFAAHKNKGMYILALTSNQSSRDFQFQTLKSGMPLFEHVLHTIGSWAGGHGGIGAVIGATQREFDSCIGGLKQKGLTLPLLVPGVGAQGGSYTGILRTMKNMSYEQACVRINASSSISYAHEVYAQLGFEEAALKAVEELTGSR
jgi:orotidine 5'-phosphate decarboxylase subfamily 2